MCGANSRHGGRPSLLQGCPHHQLPGFLIPSSQHGVTGHRWAPAGLRTVSRPCHCSLGSPTCAPELPSVLPHYRHCPALPSLFPVPHAQPSSMSALSSCQPALSFTQSHLFRGGYHQHSALHPQRSRWPLPQCLGAFAAAAVAGSPGQLNKVAWHQLTRAACDGGFAVRTLAHSVSCVCMGRGLCAQLLSTRETQIPRKPSPGNPHPISPTPADGSGDCKCFCPRHLVETMLGDIK